MNLKCNSIKRRKLYCCESERDWSEENSESSRVLSRIFLSPDLVGGPEGNSVRISVRMFSSRSDGDYSSLVVCE